MSYAQRYNPIWGTIVSILVHLYFIEALI